MFVGVQILGTETVAGNLWSSGIAFRTLLKFGRTSFARNFGARPEETGGTRVDNSGLAKMSCLLSELLGIVASRFKDELHVNTFLLRVVAQAYKSKHLKC